MNVLISTAWMCRERGYRYSGVSWLSVHGCIVVRLLLQGFIVDLITGVYSGYHYRGVSWLSLQGCIVVIITGVYRGYHYRCILVISPWCIVVICTAVYRSYPIPYRY